MRYRDRYSFHLHVTTPDGETKQAAFEVNAFVAEKAQWAPYDLCGDLTTAMIADGVEYKQAARIDKEREMLAADIAYQITNHIMRAIKAKDLRNGYKQTEIASQ